MIQLSDFEKRIYHEAAAPRFKKEGDRYAIEVRGAVA